MAAVMSLAVLPVSAVMSASAAGIRGWAGSGGRGAAIAVVPVRAYPVAFLGPVSVTVPMVMGLSLIHIFRRMPIPRPLLITGDILPGQPSYWF